MNKTFDIIAEYPDGFAIEETKNIYLYDGERDKKIFTESMHSKLKEQLIEGYLFGLADCGYDVKIGQKIEKDLKNNKERTLIEQ